MSKQKKIPGVDEKALGILAKQFPGTQSPEPAPEPEKPETPKPSPAAPAQQKKPITVKTTTKPVASTKPKKASADESKASSKPTQSDTGSRPAAKVQPVAKVRGRGLAVLAIFISLIATVLALAILAPPALRPWLQSKIEDQRIVDFLTGARFTIDQRISKADTSLENLQGLLDRITARISEIEAVGGSNEAAARRVIAVESSLGEISNKIAENGTEIGVVNNGLAETIVKMTGLETQAIETTARTDALNESLEKLSATILPQLGDIDNAVKQLEFQTAGPQKLFLYALKIRLAMQTSSPFLQDVSAAQALEGNSGEISLSLDQLAQVAATGAPTVAQLRAQFNDRLAPRLLVSTQIAPRSLVGRLGNWVDGLLLRPTPSNSSTDGISVTGVVGLAQDSLSRGDLSTAVARLSQLKGMSEVVLAEWMKAAKTRLMMNRSAAILMTKAFDRLVGEK